ncbi:hypothetical protein [Yoonia sediminilitoris]|uniref:Secreted protein with PEP-CTERM sorting signal n=1 Tax=Yoonia sediminilitoris TaxID=1286148 RepID=A0A2T6K0T6_9RHOB|nr:hypothetical protein [Yoonia sediminilitoris]PUB08235.1 hypothetical protein C8N45_1441 [Yoonia sediminilitoris]RCW89404.1 hypothetical protein DFP92_1431 [Yoonia sediminilitoris]
MVLIRAILIVFVTLSASFSGALDAGHLTTTEHHHAAVEITADDGPLCCDDSTERGQNCHVLPAVLADEDGHIAAPPTDAEMFIMVGLLLIGIELSGPVDPPRIV